jgi:hypothetical protein
MSLADDAGILVPGICPELGCWWIHFQTFDESIAPSLLLAKSGGLITSKPKIEDPDLPLAITAATVICR